jgi:uncharacterized membrane protein HdeD (DUF308 family)
VASWQFDARQAGGDIAMLKTAATGRDPYQWGFVLLQGAALFILGLLFILVPEIATVILAGCLGIYWLTSGILSIVRLVSCDHTGHWLDLLLASVLGIVAGLIVIQNPRIIAAIAPLGVVVLLAAIVIFWGANDIIQGVRASEWVLIMTGIMDIICGVLLLKSPAWIVAALPIWLGILGIIGALALIAIAYWMRGAATTKEERQ